MKNFLALGDSYTIGEQVEIIYSFPYQLVQLLRSSGHEYNAPEIIARTGWTTDELLSHMHGYRFSGNYDLVTLLIGVNNQYRGRAVSDFETDFKILLDKAVSLCNKKKDVFVLSIPDWGVTAFAEGRDRLQIANEIDDYNNACRSIAEQAGIRFIDISTSQREDGNKDDFLAADKLHPSAKEYAKWAHAVFTLMA